MQPRMLVFAICALLCLLPPSAAINEPTNFDYLQHGADWPACPANGTPALIPQEPSNPPSSCPPTPQFPPPMTPT